MRPKATVPRAPLTFEHRVTHDPSFSLRDSGTVRAQCAHGPVTFASGVVGTVRAQFWGTVWGWARHFCATAVARSSHRSDLNGAGDRNRTGDPVITSDVLYQLSYTSSAMRRHGRHGPGGGRRASGGAHPRGRADEMARPPRIELGTP